MGCVSVSVLDFLITEKWTNKDVFGGEIWAVSDYNWWYQSKETNQMVMLANSTPLKQRTGSAESKNAFYQNRNSMAPLLLLVVCGISYTLKRRMLCKQELARPNEVKLSLFVNSHGCTSAS